MVKMKETSRIISVSAIGLDKPGLVSMMTTKILKLNGNILDVEENCRRGLFFIFLVIDFSASPNSTDEILDQLKSVEKEMDLKVIIDAYDEKGIPPLSEKEKHIVTILGVDQPGIIARVSTFFHQWNINIENCRMIARGKFFSMEMIIDTSRMIYEPSLSDAEAIEKVKDQLRDICSEINQSVVIQSEQIYNKTKKLIVFDVESTLIQEASLRQFLGEINGRIKLMHPRIGFKDHKEDDLESLVENAKRLKGISLRDLGQWGKMIQLNPGTLELIHILKSMGFKIALLTSGFNFFIKNIFEEAGIDYAFSNALKVDEEGVITGELEEPVMNSASKKEILEFIMNVENIQPDQVIAVGDGSTQSHFMSNVGLSIAFKPHQTAIKTDGVLSSDQIINMLYCLGMPKTELDKHFKNVR